MWHGSLQHGPPVAAADRRLLSDTDRRSVLHKSALTGADIYIVAAKRTSAAADPRLWPEAISHNNTFVLWTPTHYI